MTNIRGISGKNLIQAAFLAHDQPVFVVGWKTRRILAASESAHRVFGWHPAELHDRTTEMLHVDNDSFQWFGAISEEMLELKKTRFIVPSECVAATVPPSTPRTCWALSGMKTVSRSPP
jgi:hypothetical protein